MSSFRLTLLRHGATVAPAGMLIGHTNLSLSPLGEQQLASRNDYFVRIPPSSIASSDLGRCAGFARQLAATSGLDCHIDRNLREMHFGELDGLPKEQWSEQQRAAWALWSHNPVGYTGAGIEGWADFSARVNAAFRLWLQAGQGDHRVLITHGGVAKALLLEWLGLPAARHSQFWLAHAGMITLYWDDEYPPVLQGIDNEVVLGA